MILFLYFLQAQLPVYMVAMEMILFYRSAGEIGHDQDAAHVQSSVTKNLLGRRAEGALELVDLVHGHES